MSEFLPDESEPPIAAAAAPDEFLPAEPSRELELATPVAGPAEHFAPNEPSVDPYDAQQQSAFTIEPLPEMLPKSHVMRHPNLADACLFLICLLLGVLFTSGALGAALYFHWHGLRSLDQAAKSTSVALGTQFFIYLVAFAAAVHFFRTVWGQGYFAGLHWHAPTAYRRRYALVLTAFLCNVLAMLGNLILPFPKHAPIDQMFSTSADAWMLAIFGITIAPFFEEMIFRGFLLPSVATAWDWCAEKMTGKEPRPLDDAGNPVWSAGAMIFASLIVSAPFAMMHAEQVGKAWGPIALLYCVSLILCAVRLATRSLASSTLVHSVYNLLLFAIMFFQTDGFRHMDAM
jgi:membrane protease YdiL (CAAX protease family)